jgi:hypothetical protein
MTTLIIELQLGALVHHVKSKFVSFYLSCLWCQLQYGCQLNNFWMWDQYFIILMLASGGSLIYAYGYLYYICDAIILVFEYFSLMADEYVLGPYDHVTVYWYHWFSALENMLLHTCSGLSCYAIEQKYLVFSWWATWWIVSFSWFFVMSLGWMDVVNLF